MPVSLPRLGKFSARICSNTYSGPLSLSAPSGTRQLKDHEDRLREINDSLRKKNLRLIGIPEGTERARGPEYVFQQILAENFPNLGRETGIQIQEIERFRHLK